MAKIILIVDDDPDDLSAFCEAAGDSGLPVKCIECSDPILARQILLMTVPDVVFIDINMPAYNGYELLKDIRSDEKLADLPVAMLSTAMDDKTSDLLKTMGARFTLRKPTTYRGYIELLHHVFKDI
ncbi:response regulator [Chryseolinea sp. T2]|uniref:response regulator n=1 Tax=Chryseolinea sp. T2 TaxID=3129255 RepID=UPI00307889C0